MIAKIEHGIELLLKGLTTLLLGVLTAIVAYTVVLRFVFHSGCPAGEELCRYLFVWSAFFGIILGVKAKTHMCLTFLEDKFPKARPLVKVVYYACSYVFWVIITYYGILFTQQAATARSTLLPITMNYIYAAVPVCGIGCLIVVTLQLIHEFQKTELGKEAKE